MKFVLIVVCLSSSNNIWMRWKYSEYNTKNLWKREKKRRRRERDQNGIRFQQRWCRYLISSSRSGCRPIELLYIHLFDQVHQSMFIGHRAFAFSFLSLAHSIEFFLRFWFLFVWNVLSMSMLRKRNIWIEHFFFFQDYIFINFRFDWEEKMSLDRISILNSYPIAAMIFRGKEQEKILSFFFSFN